LGDECQSFLDNLIAHSGGTQAQGDRNSRVTKGAKSDGRQAHDKARQAHNLKVVHAGYAMEELVAELGAAFLCTGLQLTPQPREDHDSYLDHKWGRRCSTPWGRVPEQR
jgi:hypothetical protein